MNEIDKIQNQIAALLRARDHLLNQTPSDMVALADLTENIVALSRRQSALTGATLPELLPTKVEKLQSAVRTLDNAISQSKTASDIIVAATALAKA